MFYNKKWNVLILIDKKESMNNKKEYINIKIENINDKREYINDKDNLLINDRM